MGNVNRRAGSVFLAIALLLVFVAGWYLSQKDGGFSAAILGTFSAVFGFGAFVYLQWPIGEIPHSSFDFAGLQKGRIYTLLSETLQKDNWWLIVIRKPDGFALAFFSGKSLKFLLGDKTKFSVIEGGRVIPLDGNGDKAVKPNEAKSSEAVVASTPA